RLVDNVGRGDAAGEERLRERRYGFRRSDVAERMDRGGPHLGPAILEAVQERPHNPGPGRPGPPLAPQRRAPPPTAPPRPARRAATATAAACRARRARRSPTARGPV